MLLSWDQLFLTSGQRPGFSQLIHLRPRLMWRVMCVKGFGSGIREILREDKFFIYLFFFSLCTSLGTLWEKNDMPVRSQHHSPCVDWELRWLSFSGTHIASLPPDASVSVSGKGFLLQPWVRMMSCPLSLVVCKGFNLLSLSFSLWNCWAALFSASWGGPWLITWRLINENYCAEPAAVARGQQHDKTSPSSERDKKQAKAGST